jgi:putative protease
LSGYMTHRDANQGACTNSCRWKYDAHEAKENEVGDLIPTKPVETWKPETDGDGPAFLLQEQGRPGEYMPAYEDEHGTYIMNSKDLRAVQHVKTLCEIGVHSLKIEGRTKSHYYAARTAQVYRRAIDEAVAGKEFDMSMMDELETLSNRGYTEGFYRRHPPKEYQNYEMGLSTAKQQQFVGEVLEADESWLTIDVKNRFECGEKFELMTPAGNLRFTLDAMEKKSGAALMVAPGSGHIVNIPRPEAMKTSAELSLLVKDIT